MTKCKRCGRELKNSESIARGYGKRCFALSFGKEEKQIKNKKQIRGYFNGKFNKKR